MPAAASPRLVRPAGPVEYETFFTIIPGADASQLESGLYGDPDTAITSNGPVAAEDGPFCQDEDPVESDGPRCELDPRHVLGRRIDLYRFHVVSSGASYPGLFPPIVGHGLAEFVVRREVADRLRTTDLTGLAVAPVEVTDWDLSGDEESAAEIRDALGGNDALRHVAGTGRPCGPFWTVEPPEANRCCYCGLAPLRCPGCGAAPQERGSRCPRCGNEPIQNARDATPEERAAGVVLADPAAFEPWVAVDPRRWDGSDLTADGVVTRRFVDYLLSIHAWPFIAQPLAALSEGLDAATRAKLAAARRPVVEG